MKNAGDTDDTDTVSGSGSLSDTVNRHITKGILEEMDI
jgi:hypothetical protein